MYFYSATNNAFYPSGLQSEYEASDSWPVDGVEVDDSVFEKFSITPKGKMRVAGKNGRPEWVDLPPPTKEQLVAEAELEKQQRLAQAGDVVSDWRTELSLGIISDEDKEKLMEWSVYIKAVKTVDTSTAPDITWPEKPA